VFLFQLSSSTQPKLTDSTQLFDLMSDGSQNLPSTTDLLAGLELGSSTSSHVPTLSIGNTGFLQSSPPLVGASGIQLMSAAPIHPQTFNSGLIFDFTQQMNTPKPADNNNLNEGINSNSNKSANTANKKPTTWDTVGGVNIDLVRCLYL